MVNNFFPMHALFSPFLALNDNNDVEIEVCRSQVVEYNYESGSSTDPDTDTEEEKDWKTVIYVNNPVVRRNGGSGSRPSG